VDQMPNARIPAAPPGFDPESFFQDSIWHQKWQIFDGIFTPGVNPIEDICTHIALPQNLSGKRVLDIGAWNGCLSYECERRGANEVVALGPENPEHTGFHKIGKAIGSKRTYYVPGSIYDLDPDKLGYFDVVICAGVLYHLRYPLLGLDNVRRVCTGEAYFETFALDNEVIVPGSDGIRKIPLKNFDPALLDIPLWQFFRRDELHNDDSNWFGPNVTAVKQALQSAGFTVEHARLNGPRAFFRTKVAPGVPEFLAIGSGEGVYYEVLVRHLLKELKGDSSSRHHSRLVA
jgi:tRNA (mo5U34)-methyltransferase